MTLPEPRGASRTLFDNLVDYAGVFPPAELRLDEALRRYTRHSNEGAGRLLGPCLVKASQVSLLSSDRAPARLGVVADLPLGKMAVHPMVQLEMLVSPGSVEREVGTAAALSPVIYAESRRPTDLTYLEEISSLRSHGIDGRAKIRTGGPTPGSVPSTHHLARFIESAVGLGVPFKATAGLHQPIRPPSGGEHGFINLMAAVRAALAGEYGAVRDALGETDPRQFDPLAAQWREAGSSVSPESIRRAFRSFGSCSLTEPLEHLHRLGVLSSGTGR